jgi:hypothetical protein
MEYLNELPVIQITIDFVEADDVIAYGARHPYYGGWDKIIVSSDKDFFNSVMITHLSIDPSKISCYKTKYS